MVAWRGICRAEHTGSKAEFAHRLAERLCEKENSGEWKFTFDVPTYLRDAIAHAVTSCDQLVLVPENTAE
jgi:hypothetical protein